MRDRLLVIIYVLLLVLPAAAMISHAHDRPVFGALEKVKRPHVRIGTVIDERYQKKTTEWFESSIAFKGYSIYTDNTILARVFGETKPDAYVVIGKDRTLFLKEDIDGFNRTPDQVPDRAFVENTVNHMAQLQEKLRAKGRLFLPVLIPSKTTVYRDKIPNAWLRDLETRQAEKLYPLMKELMAAKHVDHIDMFPFMREKERSLVWGTYARHWTRYAGCEAVRAVVEKFVAIRGVAMKYGCDYAIKYDFPGSDDFDLWRLLNARYAVNEKRVPKLKHGEPEGVKPNALFIGTSFNWQMIKDAGESNAFARLYLNYYNKTFVHWPADEHTPVEPFTDAWRDVIYNNDIYVLDVFETYMPLSTEIVDQMLQEVDRMPPR